MKKNLLYLLFLLFITLAITCKKPGSTITKEPVTPVNPVIPVTPTDSLNVNTPATKAGIEGLLLNTYSFLDGVYPTQVASPWETGTDNWLYGSVAGGDAHKGSNASDQQEAAEIEAFTHTATDSYFQAKWDVNMLGIRYANAVLNQLPLVKDASVSVADAAEITAEARFLKGFYELELAKLWRNVPYVNQAAVYIKGYKDVTNPGPVWDKIEADFAAAAASLPVTQTAVGRPNKYAAEAFEAKALMFDHKYSQAKTLLTDLINSGVTSSGAKYNLGLYANNFNPSTKNGPESVFAVQAVVNDGSNGYDGNSGDLLNFPNGGATTCCSFFQPSISLVNAFNTDALTGLPLLDTFNNSDLGNDLGLASNAGFTPTTASLDSRLDWTVGRRGLPYLDWGIMNGWARETGSGPYLNMKSEFYVSAKAATSEAYAGWAANQSTSNNYNEIRFADVLLWAAEVEVEIGSLQTAEDYVNKVRSRAADPTGWVHTYQDAANPTNGSTTIAAANYKVGLYGSAGVNTSTGFATNGQAYSRKAVYFERMIELGMEGQRFFDLQRWDGIYGGPAGSGFMAGIINSYLNHESNVANMNYSFSGSHFTQGKNELYPIPQSQLTLAVGMKQNPGY